MPSCCCSLLWTVYWLIACWYDRLTCNLLRTIVFHITDCIRLQARHSSSTITSWVLCASVGTALTFMCRLKHDDFLDHITILASRALDSLEFFIHTISKSPTAPVDPSLGLYSLSLLPLLLQISTCSSREKWSGGQFCVTSGVARHESLSACVTCVSLLQASITIAARA